MKKILSIIMVMCSAQGFSQGFSTSAVNWYAPIGGERYNGVVQGFNGLAGMAWLTDDAGSQSWNILDMNGDRLPDIVVTAQLQGGNLTTFSPTSGQYWKVYLNSGTGFSTTATNWTLPGGGDITNGVTNGFNSLAGTAVPSDNAGSQSWMVTDMNGDKKPDLVVTAQLQGGNVTSFSPASSQYWKVYLNSGSGFATTAINWTAPNGGDITGGVTYGFNASAGVASSSDNAGSQTWGLSDLNGDGKPDLVVGAQLQGGFVTSFSPSSNQYWKVYMNSGTGFSTSATNWYAPNGGEKYSGATQGFTGLAGAAWLTDDAGSQTWSVADMNGDALPDLVVTAQLQGGNITTFSPTSGQYWKVYLNTGTSFNTTAINWTAPNGGNKSGGITKGFSTIGGFASSSDDTGSQSWSVLDITGDSKPDLIITAQLQAGKVTSFSPTSGQYWKVYANTGTGFSTTAINWTAPNGGDITDGVTHGFNAIGGTAVVADNAGSQTWGLADINGNGTPDLIVAGQLQGGFVTSFSPTSNQYWKVYMNTSNASSVEDHPAMSGVSVYPNPSTGIVNISAPADWLNVTVKVYDLTGREISVINGAAVTTGLITLDLSAQQQGIYFIRLESEEIKITKRIVISK